MKKLFVTFFAVICLVTIALIITPSLSKCILKALYPIKYEKLVNKYASQYNMDPYFVYAVIKTESNFKKEAISNKEARGLMQITATTGKWGAESLGIGDFDEEQLLEARYNIRIGCWYLYTLSKEFDKDMTKVLAAYNGGSGNVNRWVKDKLYSSDGVTLERTPFSETNRFIEKVKKAYKTYKYLYKNKSK